MTKKVDPPRALYVDRPLGFPLGEPGNAKLQTQILLQALALLHEVSLPVRRDFLPQH
ncbi:MAG: hypothetical protein MUF01_18620 [Bryobacterales bacterium]|nr:hypothetical protein [Bryobacterales bacterium]